MGWRRAEGRGVQAEEPVSCGEEFEARGLGLALVQCGWGAVTGERLKDCVGICKIQISRALPQQQQCPPDLEASKTFLPYIAWVRGVGVAETWEHRGAFTFFTAWCMHSLMGPE